METIYNGQILFLYVHTIISEFSTLTVGVWKQKVIVFELHQKFNSHWQIFRC